MGDKGVIVHIKNIGAIITFVTFFWCVWYAIAHLTDVILSQRSDVFLRIIGVIIATLLAYVPYAFSVHLIDRSQHAFFVLGGATALACGDILLRTFILLGAFDAGGFLLIVGYPIFFVATLSFLYLSSLCVENFPWQYVRALLERHVRRLSDLIIRRRIL